MVARRNALATFPSNHSWAGSKRDKTGALNLVLTGVTAVTGGDPVIAPNPDNTMGNAQFPIAKPDRISTAQPTRVMKRKRAPLREMIDLVWDRARRPCHVQVKLGNDVVHVLAYHAPVSKDGAIYGTLACALAEPVRSQDFADVIVGGDFNLAYSNMLAEGIANFKSARFQPGTGTDGTPPVFQPSTVRYTVRNKGKVLLPPTDTCLGNPRDILYYSSGVANFPRYDSKVWNIVEALRTLDVQNSKPVSDCVTYWMENFTVPDVEQPLVAELSQSFSNKTRFSNNRIAAYFYRTFISDHLPLTITVSDSMAARGAS